MSDLLKEAIADAKAVRETALENAKAALEEAFTPQLKNMLSAKLREDEESGEDMEDMEDEEDEEMPSDEVPVDDMPVDDMPSDDEEEMEDESRAERADVDKYEYEKGKEAGEDEGEALDLEDMTDEDLKKFIEDVIADMVESGELEAGEGAEEEEGEDMDVDVDVDDVDVDVDVEDEEELFRTTRSS